MDGSPTWGWGLGDANQAPYCKLSPSPYALQFLVYNSVWQAIFRKVETISYLRPPVNLHSPVGIPSVSSLNTGTVLSLRGCWRSSLRGLLLVLWLLPSLHPGLFCFRWPAPVTLLQRSAPGYWKLHTITGRQQWLGTQLLLR